MGSRPRQEIKVDDIALSSGGKNPCKKVRTRWKCTSVTIFQSPGHFMGPHKVWPYHDLEDREGGKGKGKGNTIAGYGHRA